MLSALTVGAAVRLSRLEGALLALVSVSLYFIAPYVRIGEAITLTVISWFLPNALPLLVGSAAAFGVWWLVAEELLPLIRRRDT